jgi:ABC-2 type transport system ATP-binding protein
MPAITTETVASLSNVTKRYANGVTALDGLSLDLRCGEIVALLGPNGAGKSTAVKLMMGLSAPTSGTARIFGADPRNPTAQHLRRASASTSTFSAVTTRTPCRMKT